MRTNGSQEGQDRARGRVPWLCILSAVTVAVICLAGCVTPTPGPGPTPTWTAEQPLPTKEPTKEPTPAEEGPPCVAFEGLTLGDSYRVPDRFMDADVEITVRAFQWGNGEWTTDGYAQVDDQGLAGGSGQEMWINNVNLDFDFCCVLAKGLTLKFGEYGGNLNIEINGVFKNFANFADIDGANMGGVTATVTDGLGNDTGTLTLKGEIWSFAIGGQELWIDDVCPGECMFRAEFVECVDFEDPPLAQDYGVLDSFQDSGAVIRVAAFQWGNGQWTTGGNTTVTDQGMAGGSGQEMWINNVNLDFRHLACPVELLVIRFGEYGGNVNIDVNGDFRNAANLLDFDGQSIGGVQVMVIDGQENKPALLELRGEIRSFAIGGQELAIDDLCPWEP
jgi:hypothetical protein